LKVFKRLVGAVSHTQGHRHNVVGMVMIRIFTERALEMVKCTGMIAGVQSDRRCVHVFRGSLRGGRLARGFPLADTKIETGPFEQLSLFWIPFENGSEETGGTLEIVALECLHAALVDGYGLVKAWFPGGWRRWSRGRHGRSESRPAVARTRPWLDCNGLASRFSAVFGPLDAPDRLGGRLDGPALLRQYASCW
jgi:hypothetical protein